MLFGVERDHGSSVACYLVPDSGGTVPTIVVSCDGVELLRLDANETRQAVVIAGRHSTGLCGFAIDDGMIPRLADYRHLEISEAGSGVLIYRRPSPHYIADTKVFRLETHLLPLWRMDDALKRRFQFWYKGIDRQGIETATQAFCVNEGTSLFISGRLLINAVEFYLSKGFRSVVIFRNPYDELAERLIVLKSMTTKTMELLGARDVLTFEPVMRYLADFDQFDDASVKRMFRKAPNEVLGPLANPLTRQLTAKTLDEMASKASIAPALQVLAGFELIGLRAEAVDFSNALAEMVGIDATSLPVMAEYGRVRDLGQSLSRLRDVEGLLEQDLEIFHHTKQAFSALGAM